MGYDDMRDAYESNHDLRKEEYLLGQSFQISVNGVSVFETLDALMMKMYLDDVTSYESLALFDMAFNMLDRQRAHVRHLMVMDEGDAQEEMFKLSLTRISDWLVKAFRKDEDFVDKAVTLIMDGTAGAYFE